MHQWCRNLKILQQPGSISFLLSVHTFCFVCTWIWSTEPDLWLTKMDRFSNVSLFKFGILNSALTQSCGNCLQALFWVTTYQPFIVIVSAWRLVKLLRMLNSFFFFFFRIPTKIMLTSPSWKQMLLHRNFNPVCKMPSIHGGVLCRQSTVTNLNYIQKISERSHFEIHQYWIAPLVGALKTVTWLHNYFHRVSTKEFALWGKQAYKICDFWCFESEIPKYGPINVKVGMS